MIEASLAHLGAFRALLNELNDEEFSRCLPVLFDASLGQHVRHVLEFYVCLLAGYQSGIVNYDKRQRDLRIENNTQYAIAIADSIIASLENLDLNKPLVLSGDLGVEFPNPFALKTTFGRELAHNIEHTIHHQALIKIGLTALNRADLISFSFGIAPSTMRNMKHNHNKYE